MVVDREVEIVSQGVCIDSTSHAVQTDENDSELIFNSSLMSLQCFGSALRSRLSIRAYRLLVGLYQALSKNRNKSVNALFY